LLCRKEIYITPSKKKRGEGRFCSKRCAGIHTKSHQSPRFTSIEIKTAKILTSLGVDYESQKRIEGISVVDFFVPPDLVIECDGNYWHGSRKAKDKDLNKDVLLSFKGYRTLRLTETEINKHPTICKNKIKKAWSLPMELPPVAER
jgi:very-short-patch-repair endonuclease